MLIVQGKAQRMKEENGMNRAEPKVVFAERSRQLTRYRWHDARQLSYGV